MNEEWLRKYYDIYTCCWKLFRKYANPVDDDKFWDDLISDAEEIMKNEFAKKIVLATIDEIERIYKETKSKT